MNLRHSCVLAAALIVTTVVAGAQEKRLARKDLPPAVEKTVSENSQNATIKSFSTEVEDGRTIYEAQMVVDGHGRDISIDKQGHLLEVEDEVAFDSLPAAVQAGLKQAARGAALGKVEALTKRGTLV